MRCLLPVLVTLLPLAAQTPAEKLTYSVSGGW